MSIESPRKSTSQRSIFSQVIDGELPGHFVYEGERTVALLDRFPIRPGQTLIVPRLQVPEIHDLPEEDFVDLMLVARMVAQRIKEKLCGENGKVSWTVSGFGVPDHAHTILYPSRQGESLITSGVKRLNPADEELGAMATRLRIELFHPPQKS